MTETILEPAKQLTETDLVDRTIEGTICSLPGTSLWKDGMTRPNYVWADMSNPGEEPDVVKKFNDRNQRFALRMEEYRNAKDEPSDKPIRLPGIVGY